jgi:kinesin family member C1
MAGISGILNIIQQAKPSNAGLGHARHNSYAARNTTTSSYTSSVGPGARPPSAAGRSNFSKSVHGGYARGNPARPATAMGHYVENEHAPTQQPNCTKSCVSSCIPVSSQSPRKSPRGTKLRSVKSAHPLCPATPTPSSQRQSSLGSLTQSFGRMNIEDDGSEAGKYINTRNQAVSARNEQDLNDPFIGNNNLDVENITIRHPRGGQVSSKPTVEAKHTREGGAAVSCTPSKPSQDVLAAMARLKSTLKRAEMPNFSASCSPTKKTLPFLTKDSNTRDFVAWDSEDRLREFESEFEAFKDKVNASLTDSKKLEEAVEVNRTRGEHRPAQEPSADWKTLTLRSERS